MGILPLTTYGVRAKRDQLVHVTTALPRGVFLAGAPVVMVGNFHHPPNGDVESQNGNPPL